MRQLIGLTGQYASVDETLTGAENLLLIGRLLGMSAARGEGPRRASCSRDFDLTTPPTARPRPTPAACGAASTWPRAWSAGPGSCSSTSRPPAWTRGPQRAVGARPRPGRRRGDGAADHAVPRRGRPARRRHRGHRPRPGDRHRHAGRAEGQDRRADPGRAAGRSRRTWRRWSSVVGELAGSTPEVDGQLVTAQVTDPAVLPAVVRRLDDAGVVVTELALRGSSLDEVFLALTGHRGRGSEAEPRGADDDSAMTAPRPPHRSPPARRAPLDGLRQTAHAGLAHAGADPAQPVGAGRLQLPADHVRAAVHLRVRRRDRRARPATTSSSRCPASS